MATEMERNVLKPYGSPYVNNEFKEAKLTLQLSTGPTLLGTMTVVFHSVILLLPIVLTTITLAAEPVKGDVSEGDLTLRL